jgi:hypothetical protein
MTKYTEIDDIYSISPSDSFYFKETKFNTRGAVYKGLALVYNGDLRISSYYDLKNDVHLYRDEFKNTLRFRSSKLWDTLYG